MIKKIILLSLIIILISAGIGYLINNKETVNPNGTYNKLVNADSKANNNDGSNVKSDLSLTNEDFIIKDNNNYIELEGRFENLVTNDKNIEIIPAHENHIYETYVYDNFKILIQPGGDNSNIILSIDLTTPVLKTSRGISVGATLSKVVEEYGYPDNYSNTDSITSDQYYYQYDGKVITFFIDEEDKVVLIRYEIV